MVQPGTTILGRGAAPGHHGEWLQGEFFHAGGYDPALVSVPCPLFRAEAEFLIDPHRATLTVVPAGRVKALRAARLTLESFGAHAMGGQLRIRNPAPVGFGFGSSTADCLSAVRAVAAALQQALTADAEAHLAVSAEGASDGTMCEVQPALFAQCKGKVLEAFLPGWPELIVLGFPLFDEAQGVDTLAVRRPDYAVAEREEFEALRQWFRHGIMTGSVELLGRVADRSAEINQRYFPIPRFPQLRAVAQASGAAGLQIAHTGCIAGLIFRNDNTSSERLCVARHGLRRIGIARDWRFRLGTVPAAEDQSTGRHAGFGCGSQKVQPAGSDLPAYRAQQKPDSF